MALAEIASVDQHPPHDRRSPSLSGRFLQEINARSAHILTSSDPVGLDYMLGLFGIRAQRSILPVLVAVGRRADLRPALDRVALGGLPTGDHDHVVPLQRRHRQQHGKDERAERPGRIDVLLNERQVSAKRLNALHVIDRASDVASKAVEPPARDAFGLAALDALDRRPQTGPILGASGLVLIDVPDRDLHAQVLCPASDSLSLHGRRYIAGSLAAHSAADSYVSVEACRCRHRTPDQG